MAKKSKPISGKSRNGKLKISRSTPVRSTPVRRSAVPKIQTRSAVKVAPARPEITHELIAQRAYFISLTGECRSEHDNWVRAERELRGA